MNETATRLKRITTQLMALNVQIAEISNEQFEAGSTENAQTLTDACTRITDAILGVVTVWRSVAPASSRNTSDTPPT